MKKIKNQDEKSEKKVIELKVLSSNYRRPYGLLQGAGVSTAGLTPRDAWNEWNNIRREERASKNKDKAIKKGTAKIPELSSKNQWLANSNSFFNRGDNVVREYKRKAEEINSWDISLKQKEKLMKELNKRYERELSLESQHVPIMVAGPAGYNPRKMDKSEQILQHSVSTGDWFNGVRKSVKNSKEQYQDTRAEDAKRAEENFNNLLKRGWYNRNREGDIDPTQLANGLAPIAQYDPKRYAELYEMYDKKYHFRKNTNAAKLYEGIKTGTYKGAVKPKKIHESDSYNTYRKTIQSGERVFLKFTTKPKPQMIYALKKRGWYWNANESAWSISEKKYDENFVKNIEKNYEKYL